MRIHQIEVSNVLKIKDVTAKFNPHFQVVGGRNAQGKSSLIQAIWLALGGGNASKETVLPIRHGETKASVVLDLGFTVTVPNASRRRPVSNRSW